MKWLLGVGLCSALMSNVLVGAQPNVLVFFVDDMGWADTEINGSTVYESPAQLRLAEDGLVFGQAYAHPLCSPSRAAILSGQYPGARFDMSRAITGGCVANPSLPESFNPKYNMVWPGSRDHLPAEVTTLAETLKDNGYQTWHLGKWHLRPAKKHQGDDVKSDPVDHGFEKWVGIGGSGPRSYFAPYKVPDFPQGPEGEYIGERMAQEACKLLESRDKDKPFFMYYACFNVHSPYQAKQDLIEYYEKKLKSMPADTKQTNPVMAAMLHGMDQELEVLLDKLDELQLTEETLIIFTSDNGGVHWEMSKKKDAPYSMPVTSNYPLRGGKCSWFEGGVRVPMTIRWPGKIPARQRTETPAHIIDIYPTVLNAAGIEPQPGQILDGVDLTPLLENQTIPERPLFCHFPRSSTTEDQLPGGSFVRMGNYKLIRMYGGADDGSDRYILYNLKDDIGETTDVAKDYPEKVASMKKKLNAWLAETGALVPKPNPAYADAQ
ncbi:MAG: sulfatase [Coraliomargarita sp.]